MPPIAGAYDLVTIMVFLQFSGYKGAQSASFFRTVDFFLRRHGCDALMLDDVAPLPRCYDASKTMGKRWKKMIKKRRKHSKNSNRPSSVLLCKDPLCGPSNCPPATISVGSCIVSSVSLSNEEPGSYWAGKIPI